MDFAVEAHFLCFAITSLTIDLLFHYNEFMLGQSIIDIEDFQDNQIDQLFDLAKIFKNHLKEKSIHRLVDHSKASKKIIYLFFAEPSTRTRVSFETACDRLGVKKVSLGLDRSSVAKGETLEDTLTILQALQPDGLIFRSGKLKLSTEDLHSNPIPIINAGLGTQSHPSQALADAMTIIENKGQVKGEKILIVGDILHSRVANSNLKLMIRMGAEVAYCSPKGFTPNDDLWREVKNFETLNDGIKWATVLVCLRVQEEKHQNIGPIGFSVAEYRDKYRVGYDQTKILSPKGIILHPGPVIRGVEISNFALRDTRCKILEQVENGLYVRLALLCLILDLRI